MAGHMRPLVLIRWRGKDIWPDRLCAVLWEWTMQREELWDGESLSGWSLDSKEADGPMDSEHHHAPLQPHDHEGTCM